MDDIFCARAESNDLGATLKNVTFMDSLEELYQTFINEGENMTTQGFQENTTFNSERYVNSDGKECERTRSIIYDLDRNEWKNTLKSPMYSETRDFILAPEIGGPIEEFNSFSIVGAQSKYLKRREKFRWRQIELHLKEWCCFNDKCNLVIKITINYEEGHDCPAYMIFMIGVRAEKSYLDSCPEKKKLRNLLKNQEGKYSWLWDFVPVVGNVRTIRSGVRDLKEGNKLAGTGKLIMGTAFLAADLYTLGQAGVLLKGAVTGAIQAGKVGATIGAKEAAKVVGEQSSKAVGKQAARELAKKAGTEAAKRVAKQTAGAVAQEVAIKAGEEMVKQVAKGTAKKAGGEVAKQTASAVAKEVVKKASGEVAKQTASAVAKEVAKKAGGEVAKQTANAVAKEVAKKAGGEVAKQTANAVAKEVAKKAGEEVAKQTANAVAKEVAKKAGGVVAKQTANAVAKEVAKKAGGEVAKQAANAVAKEVAKKAGGEVAKQTANALAKEVAKKAGGEVAKQAANAVAKEVAKKAGGEVAKQTANALAKEVAKKAGGEVAKQTANALAKAVAKKAGGEVAKQTANAVAKEVAKKAGGEVVKQTADALAKEVAKKAGGEVAKQTANAVAKEVAKKVGGEVAKQTADAVAKEVAKKAGGEVAKQTANVVAKEVAKKTGGEVAKQTANALAKEVAKKAGGEVAKKAGGEILKQTVVTTLNESAKIAVQTGASSAAKDLAMKTGSEVVKKAGRKSAMEIVKEGTTVIRKVGGFLQSDIAKTLFKAGTEVIKLKKREQPVMEYCDTNAPSNANHGVDSVNNNGSLPVNAPSNSNHGVNSVNNNDSLPVNAPSNSNHGVNGVKNDECLPLNEVHSNAKCVENVTASKHDGHVPSDEVNTSIIQFYDYVASTKSTTPPNEFNTHSMDFTDAKPGSIMTVDESLSELLNNLRRRRSTTHGGFGLGQQRYASGQVAASLGYVWPGCSSSIIVKISGHKFSSEDILEEEVHKFFLNLNLHIDILKASLIGDDVYIKCSSEDDVETIMEMNKILGLVRSPIHFKQLR